MLKKYSIALIVFLVITTGSVVFALLKPLHQPEDSNEYILAAGQFSTGALLFPDIFDALSDEWLLSRLGPGYPALLYLAGSLTDSMLPVFILQLLLSIGSFMLMLRIFKPDRNMQLLLLVMLLLFPAQILFTNLLLPDILFQFVIMLAAAILFNHINTGKIRVLWFYQALIFIAILIEPLFYIFVIPNLILFIVLYFKSKQRLVFISSLIPIVFLIIIGGVNQQKTGYYHITTKKQIITSDENLYFFLLEEKGFDYAENAIAGIHAECDRISDLPTRMTCLKKSSKKYINEDRISYYLFRSKEILNALIDPGSEYINRFFKKNKSTSEGTAGVLREAGIMSSMKIFLGLPVYLIILLSVLIVINIARMAGFLVFLFNRSFKPEFRLALLLFVFTALIIAPAPGTERMILPVFFLISGGAIVQYGQWINRYLNRKASVEE